METSAPRILPTLVIALWATSVSAQTPSAHQFLDPRTAFADAHLVLSDPNATDASKASAREIVRAAGLALGDAATRAALREAGMIDACTAATEEARRGPPPLAPASWKKVPAACGPDRPETIAAYAALARAATAPGARSWWARVLQTYASSVPWSASLTSGAAADDVADAYLDMVEDRVQKFQAGLDELPRHPFPDVFTVHDVDSGAQLHAGLAPELWDDLRGIQATLEPVRRLDSPCGNARVDQTLAALMDGLYRALFRVYVPSLTQASQLYLQQMAAATSPLTTPPRMSLTYLPQYQQQHQIQHTLSYDAMNLYTSALLRAGEVCPERVGPSRQGLAELITSLQDWSACKRLGRAYSPCTSDSVRGSPLAVTTPMDPLPQPSPIDVGR